MYQDKDKQKQRLFIAELEARLEKNKTVLNSLVQNTQTQLKTSHSADSLINSYSEKSDVPNSTNPQSNLRSSSLDFKSSSATDQNKGNGSRVKELIKRNEWRVDSEVVSRNMKRIEKQRQHFVTSDKGTNKEITLDDKLQNTSCKNILNKDVSDDERYKMIIEHIKNNSLVTNNGDMKDTVSLLEKCILNNDLSSTALLKLKLLYRLYNGRHPELKSVMMNLNTINALNAVYDDLTIPMTMPNGTICQKHDDDIKRLALIITMCSSRHIKKTMNKTMNNSMNKSVDDTSEETMIYSHYLAEIVQGYFELFVQLYVVVSDIHHISSISREFASRNVDNIGMLNFIIVTNDYFRKIMTSMEKKENEYLKFGKSVRFNVYDTYLFFDFTKFMSEISRDNVPKAILDNINQTETADSLLSINAELYDLILDIIIDGVPFLDDNKYNLASVLNCVVSIIKTVDFNIEWTGFDSSCAIDKPDNMSNTVFRSKSIQIDRGYDPNCEVYYRSRIPISVARIPLLLLSIKDKMLELINDADTIVVEQIKYMRMINGDYSNNNKRENMKLLSDLHIVATVEKHDKSSRSIVASGSTSTTGIFGTFRDNESAVTRKIMAYANVQKKILIADENTRTNASLKTINTLLGMDLTTEFTQNPLYVQILTESPTVTPSATLIVTPTHNSRFDKKLVKSEQKVAEMLEIKKKIEQLRTEILFSKDPKYVDNLVKTVKKLEESNKRYSKYVDAIETGFTQGVSIYKIARDLLNKSNWTTYSKSLLLKSPKVTNKLFKDDAKCKTVSPILCTFFYQFLSNYPLYTVDISYDINESIVY